MSDSELYEMKLHDEIEIWRGFCVTRVPGGWIYRNDTENGSGGWDMTNVFVPFNSEFLSNPLTNTEG